MKKSLRRDDNPNKFTKLPNQSLNRTLPCRHSAGKPGNAG
jgi:hypothetical protein